MSSFKQKTDFEKKIGFMGNHCELVIWSLFDCPIYQLKTAKLADFINQHFLRLVWVTESPPKFQKKLAPMSLFLVIKAPS